MEPSNPGMVDLIWIAGVVNDDLEENVYDEKVALEEDCLLDPILLQKGIAEEMAFMEKIEMFEESTEEECWAKTGKAPTTTRWVSVKKVLDDGEEIVRKRQAATSNRVGQHSSWWYLLYSCLRLSERWTFCRNKTDRRRSAQRGDLCTGEHSARSSGLDTCLFCRARRCRVRCTGQDYCDVSQW